MFKIPLDKPLAVFDIESTGINRRVDRIIDLAIVVIPPEGERQSYVFRVNPEMPIPPESTDIHGITDDDVKNAPTFKDMAPAIADILQGCDLCGFNVLGFDIPMLCEEFERAGMLLDMEGRRVLDAQRIFHKKEPRDLTAALQFYCGDIHEGAHGALEDVLATIRVVEGQFDRYDDLPQTMDELDTFCDPKDPTWVDKIGRLKWVNGAVTINFGKKQGCLLQEVIQMEPSFINWMLKNDFPRDTKDILRKAQQGIYPEHPEKKVASETE